MSEHLVFLTKIRDTTTLKKQIVQSCPTAANTEARPQALGFPYSIVMAEVTTTVCTVLHKGREWSTSRSILSSFV